VSSRTTSPLKRLEKACLAISKNTMVMVVLTMKTNKNGSVSSLLSVSLRNKERRHQKFPFNRDHCARPMYEKGKE